MLNIRSLSIEIPLGSFDDVVAVYQGGASNIMVIDRDLVAHVLYFVSDRPLSFPGMFGEDIVPKGYNFIKGVRFDHVVATEVVDLGDLLTWDFHRKELRITSSSGAVFVFTLYCVGFRETKVA